MSKASFACLFARPFHHKSLAKLFLGWPGSVHSWAGSVLGHCVQIPPPPSFPPPRRGEGLPGTRLVLWRCHPGWRKGALPPVAAWCRNDRGTGEGGSETGRVEGRSGTEACPHFSQTSRSAGHLRECADLTTRHMHFVSEKYIDKSNWESSYIALIPLTEVFLMALQNFYHVLVDSWCTGSQSHSAYLETHKVKPLKCQFSSWGSGWKPFLLE